MKNFLMLLSVFLCAFVANTLWEHAHAILYTHYKGGVISEFVLLHATLVDAAIITLTIAISWIFPRHYRMLFLASTLFIIAVLIELWALMTHRWAYGPLMPIIPFINIGLTPTIQLVTTAWFSIRVIGRGRTL